MIVIMNDLHLTLLIYHVLSTFMNPQYAIGSLRDTVDCGAGAGAGPGAADSAYSSTT